MGGNAYVFLGLSVGFTFAMLVNLGQKMTTQDSDITMAVQSMQPVKAQLSHLGRPLPPLSPKQVDMALMKSGMSIKEYEANKRRCEKDAVRYAGKVMGNT